MGGMSAWPAGGSLWEPDVGAGLVELVLRHCREGGREGKGAWGQPGGRWIVKAKVGGPGMGLGTLGL